MVEHGVHSGANQLKHKLRKSRGANAIKLAANFMVKVWQKQLLISTFPITPHTLQ